MRVSQSVISTTTAQPAVYRVIGHSKTQLPHDPCTTLQTCNASEVKMILYERLLEKYYFIRAYK